MAAVVAFRGAVWFGHLGEVHRHHPVSGNRFSGVYAVPGRVDGTEEPCRGFVADRWCNLAVQPLDYIATSSGDRRAEEATFAGKGFSLGRAVTVQQQPIISTEAGFLKKLG